MNPFHGPGAPKEELPALLMILLILAFLGWVAGQTLLVEGRTLPHDTVQDGLIEPGFD